MHLIASWQIRNRSTVGGNLVNASPIGDVTILMLALGAEVVLETVGSERRVSLSEFYLGYKQLDLKPGEILTAILVHGWHPLGPRASRPLPSGPVDFVDFEKVSKRRTLDIATVNTAVRLRITDVIEEAGLAAGGVAPIPLALTETSRVVVGRPLGRETLALAVATAQEEISPISDIRGSADYKRLLVRNLLVAHFTKAAGTAADAMFDRQVA
jgi:xanthine dehydrogenase small subunit